MQEAIWKGVGNGQISNPFVIEVNDYFDKQKPFSIFLENNFLSESFDESYFRFSDDYNVYLLGLIVQDNGITLVKTINAVEKTLFNTDIVRVSDGSYILTHWNNRDYILKQQVFGEYETPFTEELNERLEQIVADMKEYTDIRDVEIMMEIPRYSIGSQEPDEEFLIHFWFDTDNETEDDISDGRSFDTDIVQDLDEEPFKPEEEVEIVDLGFGPFILID